MGTWVNGGKVSIPSTHTLGKSTDILTEIGTLLGVGKRTDGMYHIADVCGASSINMCAKYKPESYNTTANLTNTQRASNKYGFGTTPTISTQTASIPHAVYEYKKPTGTGSALFRIRDFDGYNHAAVSPMAITWPTKIYSTDSNGITIMVQNASTGWDENSCVKISDIVDSPDYYFAVLVNNGSTNWLMPTQTKISAAKTQNQLIINLVFARTSDKLSSFGSDVNKTVLPLPDNTSSVTMAVVATNQSYTGNAITSIGTLKSLELTSGSDRKTLSVTSVYSLDGISGYLNTTWKKTATSTVVNNLKAYSLSGTTLKVNLATTSAWTRTSVYIKAEIVSSYGYISNTLSGTQIGTLTLGKDIAISKSSSGTYTIADLSNYYVWAYEGVTPQITVRLTAYVNSNEQGDSKAIDYDTIVL
jgi:hypothetical protein